MFARFFLLVLLLLPVRGQDSDLPAPEKFFGHRPGADRKVISYHRIVEYLEALAAKSGRIRVFDLGKTTYRNRFVMAAISTPENLENRERFAKISRALLSGRPSEKEARSLAEEGKAIVLVTCNIHSTEIASSQTAPELAYDAVRGRIPLDDVILLLMPSINPDGQLMVKEWYDKNVGTPFEGGPMPWLYHPYAGHDNNRDWYMFNLAESLMVSEVYYRTWLPQIILDHHQMGSTGARIWVPPHSDPPNPNVHPLVYRWLNVFGTHMALDLERSGRTGVSSQWIFTSWWPGTSIMTPWWHNRIGILTESASCRIATPIQIDPSEASSKEHTVIQPNPWKGGWWHLRDIVDQQLTSSRTVLDVAARYREEILFHSWKMARDQIAKGEKEPPFAYVIPSTQRDFSAVQRLTEALHAAAVEMQAAEAPFRVGDREFPAGTTIVPLAQAARGYVKDLFERQKYPSTRRPYDMSGWTLPLQMGVDFVEAKEKFEWKGSPIERAMPPKGDPVPAGKYAAVLPGQTGLSRLANILLAKKKDVYWLAKPSGDFPAGSLVVRLDDESTETLTRESARQGFRIRAVQGGPEAYRLKEVRVGLFKPWVASMDEGWTRLVLEQFSFPYRNIDNARIRKGELKGEFDCILLPDVTAAVIKSGRWRPDDKGPEIFPEPYDGGIGEEGVKALQAFVDEGGTVLALDSSADFAIETFKLPVRNVLKEAKEFACPGSVLACEIEPDHPITFGMPAKSHLYFVGSPAFQTSVPPRVDIRRKILVRYPEKETPLASGWLQGEKAIQGRAALVEVRLGEGRVVLYGFRPQHRAQTWGTYKLLFNAIHLSAAEETKLP